MWAPTPGQHLPVWLSVRVQDQLGCAIHQTGLLAQHQGPPSFYFTAPATCQVDFHENSGLLASPSPLSPLMGQRSQAKLPPEKSSGTLPGLWSWAAGVPLSDRALSCHIPVPGTGGAQTTAGYVSIARTDDTLRGLGLAQAVL